MATTRAKIKMLLDNMTPAERNLLTADLLGQLLPPPQAAPAAVPAPPAATPCAMPPIPPAVDVVTREEFQSFRQASWEGHMALMHRVYELERKLR